MICSSEQGPLYGHIMSVIVRMNGLNGSVLGNIELGVLHASLMSHTLGKFTVMVEDIPLAVYLKNGVICCPSEYRLHYPSLIGEGTFGLITLCIAEIMCGTGGV